MFISVAVLGLGLLFAVGECDKRPEIRISNVTFDNVAHYEEQGNRISRSTPPSDHHNETLENKIANGTLGDVDNTPEITITNGTLGDVRTPENTITNGTLGDVRTPENTITNGTVGDVRTPENTITNGTLGDVRTLENTITNGTLGDVRIPENTITNGTLGDVDKTPENTTTDGTLGDVQIPENTITNGTLGDVDKTPENTTTNGTLGDVRTPENTITNETLGDVDKTPENTITNGTLGDVRTPENTITNRTLVDVDKTPENTITNGTLGDVDKTPENTFANGTLGDVRTPENTITNGTLGDVDVASDNEITNETLVDEDEASENTITNGTLADLNPDEAPQNRIFIEPMVRVGQDESPENRILGGTMTNGTLVDEDDASANAITNGALVTNDKASENVVTSVTLVDDAKTPENRITNGTLADLSPDKASENQISNEPVVRVGQHEIPKNGIVGALGHPGQFPFFVFVSTGANDSKFCGGIMLTYVWILTPAHCVLPAVFQNINVTAGIVSFNPSEKIESVRKVRKLIIHPEFVEDPPGKFHHNVALLKLMSPFLASFEIRLSHLPAKNSWPDYHAEECFIIGWGMGKQNDNSKMNFQRINVMGMSQCTDKSEAFPQTLCTLSKAGFGPCMNDIGAPLWCQTAVVGMLVSTLNESAECGADHVVHLYEFTGDHVEWISKIIEDLPAPIELMTGRSCAKQVKSTSNLMCRTLFLGTMYTLLKQTNLV